MTNDDDSAWTITYAHLLADLDEDTRRRVIVRTDNSHPAGYIPTEITVRRHIRAVRGEITPYEELAEFAEWFHINRRMRKNDPQSSERQSPEDDPHELEER
jgi:hypothetical protein